MKIKFKLSVLTIAMLTATASTFANGPDVTGGGDVVVMKFQSSGRKFCEYLKNSNNPGKFPFSIQAICAAVDQVKVSVEDRVFKADGTEVDALNFPEKSEIKLGLKRNETKFDADFFYLATHEYISVIGVDDQDYKVSGPLILQMGLTESDSDVPARVCPTVKAEYKCISDEFDNYNYTYSIKIDVLNDVITYPQVIPPHLKQVPWIADGIEHLVTYEPMDPQHYDHDHEEYAKATCLVDGLKLETRGTGFQCKDIDKPNYQCFLQGRTWTYKKYRFNSDASVLMYYEKSTFTGINGKIRNYEIKQTCTLVGK